MLNPQEKNISYVQEMTLTEETVEQVYWKKLTTNILPIQGAYENFTLCHEVIPWLSYVTCVISTWVESQPQRSQTPVPAQCLPKLRQCSCQCHMQTPGSWDVVCTHLSWKHGFFFLVFSSSWDVRFVSDDEYTRSSPLKIMQTSILYTNSVTAMDRQILHKGVGFPA